MSDTKAQVLNVLNNVWSGFLLILQYLHIGLFHVSFVPRVHAFEIHDLEGCPEAIRNELTGLLRDGWQIAGLAKAVLSILTDAVASVSALDKNTNKNSGAIGSAENPVKIVDLCSGSGGPVPHILPFLAESSGKSIQWTMTDLFPNVAAYEENCKETNETLKAQKLNGSSLAFVSTPVDATACTLNSQLRTLFASLHHLPPPLATSVLADAYRNNQSILIVELTERSIFNLIFIPLLNFLFPFAAFFHRLASGRSSKTITQSLMLLPIMPFVLFYDGFMSIMRTYSPSEFKNLLKPIIGNDAKWSKTSEVWINEKKIIDEKEKNSAWWKACFLNGARVTYESVDIPKDNGVYQWKVGLKVAPCYSLLLPNVVYYFGTFHPNAIAK